MKGGIAELLNFKQKKKNMDEFIKVPVSEKLAYCFGDPALTLMYTMTSTLLIYFYTNVVGISAGAVGMIMLVSRIFDGFSDVAMGTIIDRTHSKYGKARIWILRLVVPYAIAAVLLFTMPDVGNMGKILYAFVTYNLMNTVVYTAISQPFHALGSLMTRDRRDRDTISNIRMMLSITASMIITAFTLPLINYVSAATGKEQLSWILVTGGYAIVSVFILLNTYATCTERVQAAPQTKKENIPFWKSFKITFTNRYFLIALGLMIAYTAYQVIIGTDLTYYCQYVLGDANLVMPLSSAEKVCTIIGIAMLPKLLPRFGKRNLICFGCAMGIIGQLLFLVNATSVPLGVVSCIIRGFGIAPFYGVQYSLPGDAIVSMNLWGFSRSFLTEAEARFPAFLDKTLKENPEKGEYYLPSVVSALIEEGKAKVKVLRSHDRWYGVTYREDKPTVVAAIARMTEEGLYPTDLWS